MLLLLYTAILFFYLPTIQSLPANLGIDSCNAQFANDDFCVQGWITFLSFLAVLVTYIRWGCERLNALFALPPVSYPQFTNPAIFPSASLSAPTALIFSPPSRWIADWVQSSADRC